MRNTVPQSVQRAQESAFDWNLLNSNSNSNYIYSSATLTNSPTYFGDIPDLGPSRLLSTTINVKISSSSAQDTFGTGSGAWVVAIFGLDANYDKITEFVVLNGQNTVTTINKFLRFRRILCVAHNPTNYTGNTGTIYFHNSAASTNGVPNTTSAIQRIISPTTGQSRQFVYTVPRNHYGSIDDFSISTGIGKELTWQIQQYQPGGIIVPDIGRLKIPESAFNRPFITPPQLSEKVDVLCTAFLNTGTEASTIIACFSDFRKEVLYS